MTRVVERIELTAGLVLQTALHIGAARSDGLAADLDVLRDGAERPVIPGTSLAGALRQRLFEYTEPDDGGLLDAWQSCFGTTTAGPYALQHPADAAASRLIVHDAPARDTADRIRVEHRDHVAIDRDTATAAPRLKYDQMVVAAGTIFDVRLILERRTRGPGSDLQLVFLAARLLEDGLTLGGSGTRGLGRAAAVTPPVVRCEPVEERDHVLAALRRRLGGEDLRAHVSAPDLPAPIITECIIRLKWKPVRSVLVRDGAEGEIIDTLPLTTTVADGRRTLLVPGSAIKGAMRTAAERVVRTAQGSDTSPLDGKPDGHARQIAVPVASTLFGAAKTRGGGGARGAAEIADVHASHSTLDSDWKDALTAHDTMTAHLALRSTGENAALLGNVSVMTHVALDRWTQGASEHRLFDVLEPTGVAFEPIVLRISLSRLTTPCDQRLAAGVLLRYVLDEMCYGDLPLGGMTTRGHGAIKIESIETAGLEKLGLKADPAPALGCAPSTSLKLADADASKMAWQAALKEKTT